MIFGVHLFTMLHSCKSLKFSFITIVSGYCTAFKELMSVHNGASSSALATLCHFVQLIMSDCECTSKYFNSVSCGNFRMTVSSQMISCHGK
jgi:hypothetical protein